MDKTIEALAEELDEKIREIDESKVMRRAQALIERKNRLQAARRALIGAGPKMTGGAGGNRVTQGEVVDWFKRKASSDEGAVFKVEEIAQEMGHKADVIRGHLNRGKDERFRKDAEGFWSLRDPKNEPEEDDEDDE